VEDKTQVVRFSLNVDCIKETGVDQSKPQACVVCGDDREEHWPEFSNLPRGIFAEFSEFEHVCPTCLMTELKRAGCDIVIVCYAAVPLGPESEIE